MTSYQARPSKVPTVSRLRPGAVGVWFIPMEEGPGSVRGAQEVTQSWAPIFHGALQQRLFLTHAPSGWRRTQSLHAKIYSEGHTKGKLSQFPRQLVASAYSPALCPQSLGAGNVQGQCEGNEEVDSSLGNSCQQYSEQVGMGNFFIVL